MKVEYKFTEKEIKDAMRFVGETYKLGSRPTETGRGRRLFADMIPPEYRQAAEDMVERCRYQYSHNSYEVKMTADEIVALRYLVDYCGAL